MNVDLYVHEEGYRVVARNIFGETCEMVSRPGDGIYEYVSKMGRLNISFIVYCLTQIMGFLRSDEQQAMLDFLNTANDHRHPRRKLRPEGWKAYAGLSQGEVNSAPKKPGDVVVHGDVARAWFRVIGE